MDHFKYIDGVLHCESIAVESVIDAVGTPSYVYSRATLLDHYRRLSEAFAPLGAEIRYAMKSAGNLEICRALAGAGAGMDLVSGGELHRARLAGVDPARCVYAGVGKTDREIGEALDAGVGWFNIESEAEFGAISDMAARRGTRCRAALRVNPDVDPQTHRYTTTGRKATKFGVDIEEAREFFARHGDDGHCVLEGLHVHIGSPVYRVEPYVEAIERVVELIDDVERDRPGRGVRSLNLGGGFGADYRSQESPVARDYAEAFLPLLADRVRDGLQIVIEPGRTISANAGILVVRVVYVKESGGTTYLVCDGGMNVLLRPALYEAFHFIWPCRVAPDQTPPRRAETLDLPGLDRVSVVGPLCESGDFLGLERDLPPAARGDLLAVFSAGAYGMAMANRYNSTPLPAEVMVTGAGADVIRRRESYDDLTAHERTVALNLPTSRPFGADTAAMESPA